MINELEIGISSQFIQTNSNNLVWVDFHTYIKKEKVQILHGIQIVVSFVKDIILTIHNLFYESIYVHEMGRSPLDQYEALRKLVNWNKSTKKCGNLQFAGFHNGSLRVTERLEFSRRIQ